MVLGSRAPLFPLGWVCCCVCVRRARGVGFCAPPWVGCVLFPGLLGVVSGRLPCGLLPTSPPTLVVEQGAPPPCSHVGRFADRRRRGCRRSRRCCGRLDAAAAAPRHGWQPRPHRPPRPPPQFRSARPPPGLRVGPCPPPLRTDRPPRTPTTRRVPPPTPGGGRAECSPSRGWRPAGAPRRAALGLSLIHLRRCRRSYGC